MIKMRTFYDNLEGEAKKGATKKIVEECYGWVDEVATEDERNALKQMHHQSHDECKAKVRELMGRLSEERSEQVENRMGFCEHVYYGKMDGEGDGGAGTAGDEHHHHHHHHTKRRASDGKSGQCPNKIGKKRIKEKANKQKYRKSGLKGKSGQNAPTPNIAQ